MPIPHISHEAALRAVASYAESAKFSAIIGGFVMGIAIAVAGLILAAVGMVEHF